MGKFGKLTLRSVQNCLGSKELFFVITTTPHFAQLFCAPTHMPTPQFVSCRLSDFVCLLSLPYFDHSWRISGFTLIKSGLRGWTPPGNPLRADFQHLALIVGAQSFGWPAAAHQSWHQSPSASVNQTAPIKAAAPLQDPHSSLQDAFTQTHSSVQDAFTYTLCPVPCLCS